MIPITPEYKEEISGSNTSIFECDVEINGRVVATLPVISGRVSVAADRQVRRTMSATVIDRTGTLVPKGGNDLLNPTVGALLKPRRGVLIPETVRVSDLYSTEASWNAGTFNGTTTTGDGGLTLATAPTDPFPGDPVYPSSGLYPSTDLYPEG